MMPCRHHHHYGEVIFQESVTAESAYALCEACISLDQDYYYKKITVVVLNNLGGVAHGLQMIKARFDKLMKSGVTITTRGVGMVASAGAMTLTNGSLGHREVVDGTLLVYHFARMQGGGTGITSQLARKLSDRLQQTDGELLAALVDHTMPLTRTSDQQHRWPLSDFLDENFRRVDGTSRVFSEQSECKSHMLAVLAEVFEADSVMSPAGAKALGLIDSVI